MNNRRHLLVFLSCLQLTACSKPTKPYISEARSKTVDARAGQEYAQYAVYNPTLSANAGIESDDVEFTTGTFILLNPSEDKLKSLSYKDFVSLYYNQRGQIIIEIKDRLVAQAPRIN